MTTDRFTPFEKYEKRKDLSFKERISLQTNSSRIQQELIREHIADFMVNHFQWNYWVVVTFGYKPDPIEAEECLSKLAYRLDRRLIKHTRSTTCLSPKKRTEWVCFPEVQSLGVHYNCFLKFYVSPHIGTSYDSERQWIEVALQNNLETLASHFPTIGQGKPSVLVRERTRQRALDIAEVLYSMKEFQRGVSHNDIDPTFDRFERIVISKYHWKNVPIHKHRSPNKVEHIPPLFDKETEQNLSKFIV